METLDLLRSQTDAANAYLIAWASLLVWDWLSMFRKEVEHIWTKKKTPVRIAYVLNRYGTLLLNSAAMFLILSSVSTPIEIPVFVQEYTGLHGCLVDEPKGKYAAFAIVL
ncbi:hypothetical protein JCM11491_001093 [Sporobolomyces phaffii]